MVFYLTPPMDTYNCYKALNLRLMLSIAATVVITWMGIEFGLAYQLEIGQAVNHNAMVSDNDSS